MLTDWWARHLHPWLHSLHLIMDSTHNGCDIATTLIGRVATTIRRAWPSVRIADIIEVDTVDIILPYNLSTDRGKVRCNTGIGWVEIRTRWEVSNSKTLLHQSSTTQRALCTHRNRRYPCVNLHATLVTFLHGKAEWVVAIARCPTLNTSDTLVPWLDIRRINRCCTHTRLQEYGVDICLLIFIENVNEFLLLQFDAFFRPCVVLRPIKTGKCRQPYGTRLPLRHSLREIVREIRLCLCSNRYYAKERK